MFMNYFCPEQPAGDDGPHILSTVEELAIRRLAFAMKTESKQLARYQKQICRAHQKISAPQAARFAAQPEEPLQPSILHPFGRLAQRTCQKWERSTHGDNWHLQAFAKFVCPDFLARTAKAYKDHLSAGLPDPSGNLVGNFRRSSSESRRLGAGNNQARKSGLKIHTQQSQNVLCAAVKIHWNAFLSGPGKH